MRLRIRLPLLLLGLAILAALGYRVFQPSPKGVEHRRLTVAETLGGRELAGFARATAPRAFTFPADHGPHPEYKTEWWYYTGNLETGDGRHFGYQLTFFRIALAPEPLARDSHWATHQIYMAHFALSDVAGQRFYSFERFARAALGLAGATAEPFRVWLEHWSAAGLDANALPMRLQADGGEIAIDLTLTRAKPVILQGDEGLSRKSAEPGNASYYYSLTRLPTTGRLRVGDKTLAVAGTSWLDREWSTSALGPDQVGWDWFSLQLDDGRELMFYRLRRRDGSADPMSSGTWVEPDGTARRLNLGQIVLEELDSWQSPRSGTTYPSRWRLEIPGDKLMLQIEPYLADQELQTSLRYWEGAVKVRGSRGAQRITGHGYVELTGYGEQGNIPARTGENP